MNTLNRFFQALAFLTIIPVKFKSDKPAEASLFAYACDFPLAGIFIGLMSGGVYFVANSIWDGLLPALLAVAASLGVTGALHEDGLADTADGFGGGWTRQQRLAIMKDSYLGAYGVLALGLSIAFRTCALAALSPGTGFFALIAIHTGARCAPVFILATQDYAGDPATAKTTYAKTRLAWPEVHYALAWTALAFLPILLMRPVLTLAGLLIGGVLVFGTMTYSKRAIGGYCGDVLGAIEQLFEIGCLLGFAA